MSLEVEAFPGLLNLLICRLAVSKVNCIPNIGGSVLSINKVSQEVTLAKQISIPVAWKRKGNKQ